MRALLLVLLMLLPRPALAERALAAVAANFARTAEVLSRAYEAETGHEITITTGSTGKLYAQIKAGAPFDLFLSADAARPRLLAGEGLAQPPVTYAIGRLALWAPGGRAGPDDLNPQTGRLAIANPALAPYGLAAQQALQSLGLWQVLQPRLVMGQNIGQTHAMVATGNVPLGLIAASALPKDAEAWILPEHLHAPIRQDAVLLTRAAQNPAAAGFLVWLQSAPARAIIQTRGFALPPVPEDKP